MKYILLITLQQNFSSCTLTKPSDRIRPLETIYMYCKILKFICICLRHNIFFGQIKTKLTYSQPSHAPNLWSLKNPWPSMLNITDDSACYSVCRNRASLCVSSSCSCDTTVLAPTDVLGTPEGSSMFSSNLECQGSESVIKIFTVQKITQGPRCNTIPGQHCKPHPKQQSGL